MEEKQLNKNNIRLKKARGFFFFVMILLLMGFSFLGGYSARGNGLYLGIGPKNVINADSGKPSNVDFSLFWEAWNTLKDKSVGTVDNQKMTEGAISGLLASVGDPYTVYFNKEENKRFKEDIQGEFDGIGIEIIQKNNLPTVVAPLPDSPAEKAGIKSGDIILEVDGTKTTDIGFDDVVNKIRGAEGSYVNLKISRENVEDPISFNVVRNKITVKSVEWNLKQSNGKKIEYIKIRQFGDDTESLFSQATDDVVKNKPDGIVLDLRNNPGGYLETAVNLASYFIKDGVIVSEKGKNNQNKDYYSNGNGILANYKVDILTNGGSASASEILAGALQDRKGDKVIGEKTFGKGSVQELIELTDGSALKITIAAWYTPSGRQINKEGINPDISITPNDSSKDDVQLNRAVEYLVSGK